MIDDSTFSKWVEDLASRHTRDLTFQEIRKGVVALSRIYVEDRRRLGSDVFEGAGKRAAFACFYTPLHFLLARHVISGLGADRPRPNRIIDLGCGLGPAGAAWALAAGGGARMIGVERSAWAASEARASLRVLGVRGRVLQERIERAPSPRRGEACIAAFAINELAESVRTDLLSNLIEANRRGAAVLVIEPIARRVNRWWETWTGRFEAEGGRSDSWRFAVELPGLLADLDRASGLDHREISGRSLYLPGRDFPLTSC